MVYQRYLQARTNGFLFDLCRFTSLCQMSSPVILFFMSVLSLCHIHFYCAVLSQVWLFATLCTVALQILCPWDSPGKNTGVGCHFLLQRIFPTQGLNPGLLHWQAGSLPLSHQGSPIWIIRSPDSSILATKGSGFLTVWDEFLVSSSSLAL